VLGGGAVGCELAQAFARLGSEVTVVEMAPRLLAREDEEVSALLEARFGAEGMRLLTGCSARRFVLEDGENILLAEQAGQPLRIGFDLLLCALGRVPNTSGYGLEELGIGATPAQMQTQTLATNDYLQTLYPNIYAAGDVAGPFQYTHAAAHQAWYATVNALFGRFRMFRADYSAMPSAVFTEPELARVGLNEQQAQARNIRYEVTRYNLEELDRAITDEAALGFIKVLTVPGRDRILGVTIVGAHAAEMIAEYVLAMKHGLGLNKILGTVHLYPSMAEANKYAAGAWKRAHAPQRLLAWAGRYHRWRRG
jgi:pyruvate/2-oxoglutarate dehydrogenase complex dihydrolipoamide dehydrogenase (E3) component